LSLSRTMANSHCASYGVGCLARRMVRLLGPSSSSSMLCSGSFGLPRRGACYLTAARLRKKREKRSGNIASLTGSAHAGFSFACICSCGNIEPRMRKYRLWAMGYLNRVARVVWPLLVRRGATANPYQAPPSTPAAAAPTHTSTGACGGRRHCWIANWALYSGRRPSQWVGATAAAA
jgi:hypothetical protein